MSGNILGNIEQGSLLGRDNDGNIIVMGIDMSDGRDVLGVAVSNIRADGTIDVLSVNSYSYSTGIGTITPEFLLDISPNGIEEEIEDIIEEKIEIRNNRKIAEDRLNAII